MGTLKQLATAVLGMFAAGCATADDGLLAIGSQAPAFEAQDERGETVRLADLIADQGLVLVFYPGDDTPGCNAQLCEIRDEYDAFRTADVAVYGVNPADATSHQRYRAKFNFPFPLLVDNDKAIAEAYGCKGLGFVTRTVYGIDRQGTIVFAQRGKPEPSAVLAAFEK